MKILYDERLMKYMTLFENLTGVKVKDVFFKNEVVNFVIYKRDLKMAIGPNGVKIKKLQELLKKRIKIIIYSEQLEEFVGNLVYGYEVDKIENKEGIVKIHCKSPKTKGLLIGRERRNLLGLKEVISRYFNIKEVQVV